MGSHQIGLEATANSHPPASLFHPNRYRLHAPSSILPQDGEPYWKRCHCMKYLYIYRENILGR